MVVGRDAQRAVRGRQHKRRRLRCPGRLWNRQRYVRKSRECVRKVLQAVVGGPRKVDAGHCPDGAVDINKVAQCTFVIDAVSGADDRLALSKPGQVPCKSD